MRHRAPPGTGGSDQSAPRTAPLSAEATYAATLRGSANSPASGRQTGTIAKLPGRQPVTMAPSDLGEGTSRCHSRDPAHRMHGTRARAHVLRIQQTLELAASSSARCRGDERGAAADDSAVGAGGGLSTGRSQAALSRLFHDHSPAHPRKARLRGTVCDVLASKGPLIFALRLGVLAGERSAVPRGLRRHSWPVIHLLSPCSLLGAVWYLTVRRSWARAAEMRFPSRAVAKDLGREGEWRMTSALHCARPTRSTDP